MTGPMRMRALATLSACALALGALAAAAAVPAAAASESKETQQEYEQQLSSGQIASVQLNRRIARVHVTLKDGTYDLYCSVPGHKALGMDTKLTVGSGGGAGGGGATSSGGGSSSSGGSWS